MFNSQPRMQPAAAPPAPTASQVKPDAQAAATARLLAAQGSGFQSTIKTGGMGVTGMVSTSQLLGGSWS